MKHKTHKAFTMIELVFVIVVIGILSSIAIPRFTDTAQSAYLTKAQTTLATVRGALATERQRRILRGDFTVVGDLALTSTNGASTNVFDHFSRDNQNVNTAIFDYPIAGCGTGQRACWVRNSATTYEYRLVSSSDGNDGKVDFTLTNVGRLDCTDSSSDDCALIEN